MGVYCYRVATNPVKTNLGFSFHQSFFCYKVGIQNDTWFGTPSKWMRLTQARLDRVQNLFDYNPDRWSGYIGSISHQPKGAPDKKLVIGSQVSIFKREYGTSNYYDQADPGTYVCTIEKIGKGKWKKVIDEYRQGTETALTNELVPVES